MSLDVPVILPGSSFFGCVATLHGRCYQGLSSEGLSAAVQGFGFIGVGSCCPYGHDAEKCRHHNICDDYYDY